jgi:hypothetical protein
MFLRMFCRELAREVGVPEIDGDTKQRILDRIYSPHCIEPMSARHRCFSYSSEEGFETHLTIELAHKRSEQCLERYHQEVVDGYTGPPPVVCSGLILGYVDVVQREGLDPVVGYATDTIHTAAAEAYLAR